ncbi:MAG: trypsin-like peptidase domain-containing protein [Oligoflexia bacterium]|nr:trypsin-like peptidase domain-containing protein [Oligoflexia bacterium]
MKFIFVILFFITSLSFATAITIATVSTTTAADTATCTASNDGDGIDKVIYGNDNRLDVYSSKNKKYKRWAVSTAALIPRENLSKTITGKYYRIKADTLKKAANVCSSERFANQITAAQCSGFLVGSDLLLTAGHCIETISDCDNYYWVFDYRLHNILPIKCLNNITVKATSVYTCVEVIGQRSDSEVDYALVRLNRKVVDRSPLTYRKSGKIIDNSKIVVIGHPVGLPTKIAAGANVRSNNDDGFFVTNLDTYGGNSGSAVINSTTGEVEGILVRGEEDFVTAPGKTCMISNKCANDSCRGEEVTRITAVEELFTK